MRRWRGTVVVVCLGLLSLTTLGCGEGETGGTEESSLASRTAQVVNEQEGLDEADVPSLEWQERIVERSTGDGDGDCEPCARIVLVYPQLTAGAPEPVLERIDRTVVAWISSEALGGLSDQDLPEPAGPDAEPPSGDPVADRAAAFIDEYERFQEAVTASVAPWWQEIRATVDSRVERVLTLRVDTESYTGGAHGLALTLYWLFDLETGEVLGLDDLVVDGRRDQLREVVEARFREVRDVPEGEDLDDAGFFVIGEGGGGQLPLTDNVAVTADGLTFQYHPYEIAPYAAGPTTVPVPWADLDGLVRRSP